VISARLAAIVVSRAVPAINTKDFAERNLVGKLIDQLDKDVF